MKYYTQVIKKYLDFNTRSTRTEYWMKEDYLRNNCWNINNYNSDNSCFSFCFGKSF